MIKRTRYLHKNFVLQVLFGNVVVVDGFGKSIDENHLRVVDQSGRVTINLKTTITGLKATTTDKKLL